MLTPRRREVERSEAPTHLTSETLAARLVSKMILFGVYGVEASMSQVSFVKITA